MADIAVLGSGHGACTYSAWLGKRGHTVRLCDSKQFADNLTAIAQAGGMELTMSESGFGKISLVTTDFAEAIADVEVILVVVPGFGHAPMAKALAPHLKSGQIVVLNPGAVFGALEFLNTLREAGNNEDVTLCETASNIFACRRTGPTVVRVMAIKNRMEIASIPADRIDTVVKKLETFFPDLFEAMPNVIHTSLMYTNVLVHPAGSALNMGRIEWTGGEYDFYWEGLTPGVCRNIEAIDRERRAIGAAMNFPQIEGLELFHRYYGHREHPSIYEFFRQSEVHGGIGPSAPPDLGHRYISEDVPYGLVPLSETAKLFDVPSPHIDALITVLSTGSGNDYRNEGRTLKKLGLEGLSKEAVIRRFLEGR